MASNLWGGEIKKINPNGGSCGSPLPNCSISSSSAGEDEQSSSSENIESSSSEEYVESSNSDEIDSSSSEDEDDDGGSSSSDGEELGTQCYIGDEELCRPWSGIILSKNRPVLVGDIRLYYYEPVCRNGNIEFMANIPAAFFVPQHRSKPFYYSVLKKELTTSWAKVDFESPPKHGSHLPYFDVDELLNIVAGTGVYEGDGDYDKDLKDLYPQFSIFRTMLDLQNAWDDEDKNNVSHERINVDREIERLKKQWQNSKCE